MAYDGENLYLSIPEPEYEPDEPEDEDRYLFPPLWLAGAKAAIVDGEKIKADTWYRLENGEFVEVE